MKRPLIVMILLLAAAAAYYFVAGTDEEPLTVIEKRIALLERPEVEKRSTELGGVQRSFMLIKPGDKAVFDDITVLPGAAVEFHLGADQPGEVEAILLIDDKAYPIEAAFEKPGWHFFRHDLSDSVGREITVTFQAKDEPLRVGNPVILSNGRPVTASAFPLILIDDVVHDLELEFETVGIIRQDETMNLSVLPMQLLEKRTQADDQNTGIVAKPDSAFAYTTTLLPGSYLEVAAINFPTNLQKPDDPGNVEFSITIDGEVVFSLCSDFVNGKQLIGYFNNPYANLIHREEIDLDRWAGRTVRIVFMTEHTDRSLEAKGAYCWWDLRIKRKQEFPRRRSSPKAPNVIVVCIDALRADHLGCYGYERATSPNLDALAERSLVFENAVTPCSWTLPATASLLTGLYPNTHGVLGNGREYLVDKIWTLAENLVCRGVSTAAFSANTLVCSAINFDQGFERFIEVDERADGVNAELFAWLEEHKPFQFFAYVHYMEPHSPYSAPGEFRQRFNPGYVEKRDFSGPLPERWRLGKVEKVFTDDESQHLVDLYDSEICYWDHEFQRLLVKLEELGLEDDTIVIVTADHGEEFFDHGGLGHGLTLYGEVVQVPLILHDPRVRKGLRVTERVSTGALFDTVSELMGAKPYPGTQIKGLLPLKRIPSRFERVYSSTESNMPEYEARWAGMLEGPWKVVTDVDGKTDLLFDVEKDPGEGENLFNQLPEEGSRLKVEALDWYRRTAGEFPDVYQPSIPELLEELKRLGYVGGK